MEPLRVVCRVHPATSSAWLFWVPNDNDRQALDTGGLEHDYGNTSDLMARLIYYGGGQLRFLDPVVWHVITARRSSPLAGTADGEKPRGRLLGV